MLHITQSALASPSDHTLRSMFAARKRVFIDLLGWDIPALAGRYEVDQFDDPHCIYLILADPDGQHLASARLLPTMRPHILGDLFPQLCAAAPPRAPDIFEITRFCLDPDLPATERRRVRDTLIVALADHALAVGIRRYAAIAERPWARQIERFGWRTQRLGMEWPEGNTMLAALAIDVEPHTPALLARAGIRADTRLRDDARRDAA